MWKITLKQIWDRKIRFLLTTAAVVIGVAFVVSTFVLADSLRTTFDELAGDIQSNTDLTVRSAGDFGNEVAPPPVPSALEEQVAAVDGVVDTTLRLTTFGATLIDADGEAIVPSGPPSIGLNWIESPSLQQYFPTDGTPAPTGPGEFVVNVDAAQEYDLIVGDSYEISGPIEQREFTLVGTANFADPDEDKSIGAVSMIFDTPTAQEFLALEDQANDVAATLADGADEAEVVARLQAAVGPDYEVATQAELTEETSNDFGEIVSIFNNVLLAFALITLFVAAFLVNNIFSIVVSQRVRELALLRAVGATGAQISRSIVGEAFVVGVFSTAAGIGLGVLLAIGLQGLLAAVGFDLPAGPIELRLRTIVFAAVVGIGITVLSALAPAIRARRVPPVAAMRDGFSLTSGKMRRRLVVGGATIVVGAAALTMGLFGSLDTIPLLTAVAFGAVAIFLGVNAVSPAFAAPVARALGAPIRAVLKLPGRLAQENAARAPRRTASTAGALMIGLALVTMAAVIGDSIKSTFVETLDNAVESDFYVQGEGGGFGPGTGFTGQVAEEFGQLADVESVARFRFGFDAIEVGGSAKNVMATDFDVLSQHIDPDVQDGSVEGIGPRQILVHEDPAEDLGLTIGSVLTVGFNSGDLVDFEVAAVYADSTILDNWVIDIEDWEASIADRSDAFVSLLAADGVDLDALRAEVDAVAEEFPTIKVEDRAELKQSTEDQLNSFLAVISVFLLLSLVIAVMGIAITLSLSVFERTRELGLLRAVGMTRRQMRRMVRWESVIVALFGALVGVGLGVLFGVAASTAIPETVIKELSIPVGQLLGFFGFAVIAGIGAAIFPSYRAGRLNVLDAIADQ